MAEVQRPGLAAFHVLPGLVAELVVRHGEARRRIAVDRPAGPRRVELVEARERHALHQPVNDRIVRGNAGQHGQPMAPFARLVVGLVGQRFAHHADRFRLRSGRETADGHGRLTAVVETAVAVVAGLALHAADAAVQRRHDRPLGVLRPHRLHGADEQDVTRPVVIAAKLVHADAQLAAVAGSDLVGGKHVGRQHLHDVETLALAVVGQRLDGVAETGRDHDDPLRRGGVGGREQEKR